MLEPIESAITPEPPEVRPTPRGRPLIAWAVIVLVTAGLVALPLLPSRRPDPSDAERFDLRLVEYQGKYIIGSSSLLGNGGALMATQLEPLRTGPVSQRLGVAVLSGDLAGPKAALDDLARLERKLAEKEVTLTPMQADLLLVLKKLYGDYAAGALDAPSLSEAERELLGKELGWFGRLALAPPLGPDPAARAALVEPAQRLAVAVVSIVSFALILGVLGLSGLIVFLALLLHGKLRIRFACGSANGGIYAETFAVWLLLFPALGLAGGYLAHYVTDARPLVAGGAGLLSLVALAWPVLRGVPWRQVRRDIGWTGGAHPVVEPAAGLGSYLMALPLLGIGALLMFGLLYLQKRWFEGAVPPEDNFNPAVRPYHPAVDWMAQSDWRVWLQVLFLASVVAPIVEETMFRGVLYRHLREATASLRFVGSTLLSATIASFLFAVVHPQGFAAVPALMALAYGFNLAREWRDSVLPAMVAHGVHNAALVGLSIVLFSA